jgi:hypothetical protein
MEVKKCLDLKIYMAFIFNVPTTPHHFYCYKTDGQILMQKCHILTKLCSHQDNRHTWCIMLQLRNPLKYKKNSDSVNK